MKRVFERIFLIPFSISFRFSRIRNSVHKPSYVKKEELRNDIKHIKELSATIKQDRRVEKEEKKERRLENEKRKLENQRKSEVVQIIKNPAKLKRLRKKQLRKIEKRDLSTVKTA